MARIPKEYDTLPIGRQIKRNILGRSETGVVKGLKLATGEWTVYHVAWETSDKKSFTEDLALTTIQSYYSVSDAYVDDAFVADDIRLQQQNDWDDSKCPKKGTKAWEEAVRGLWKDSNITKSPAKVSKGKKSSGTKHLASAAAKNDANAGDDEDHQAKKLKTSIRSPGIAGQLKANVLNAANIVEDTLKGAPQVLGQAISDALPNSSKKASTSKPSASTGTTGTAHHQTQAAQQAQEAIQAMSPARGSGTGQASKKQGASATRRVSARHLPETVTAHKTDESVVIEGEQDNDLAQTLKQIASSLSAAPRSQAQTSEQSPSFKVTGLQGQASNAGTASPPQRSVAGPSQDEEMLELPSGSRPLRIPKSLSIKKNDVLVEVYTAADYDTAAEYVVDSIVAEKTKGKKTEYLVKWKGYELDPNEWTPRANLEEVEALEVWLNKSKKMPPSRSPRKVDKQAGTRKSGRH